MILLLPLLLLGTPALCAEEGVPAVPVAISGPAVLSVEDYAAPEAVDQAAEIELERAHAGSLRKEFRAARREYRAWLAQGDHRERASAFLKEFKAAVKRRDYELAVSTGAARFRCRVRDAWRGEDGDDGLHVFVAGVFSFDCAEPGGPMRSAELYTVGPGLAVTSYALGGAVACAEPLPPGKARAFGVSLSAGFHGMGTAGLFFGRGGVCGVLVGAGGFGASAGFSRLLLE